MGASVYNAPPVRFSRTPVELKRPAPLLGEHTDEICRELIGISAEEIRELKETGVLV